MQEVGLYLQASKLSGKRIIVDEIPGETLQGVAECVNPRERVISQANKQGESAEYRFPYNLIS